MRDEIIAGMQNAVARGQTLEQAAQSFINAGYNPQEVKAAYQMLSSGATTTLSNTNVSSEQRFGIMQNDKKAIGNYGKPLQSNYNQPLQPQQMQQKPMPNGSMPQQNPNPQFQQAPQPQSIAPAAPPNNPPEKKKGGGLALMITMIVVAALILLGALGYLFYVLVVK